jgi:hypothetical protein
MLKKLASSQSSFLQVPFLQKFNWLEPENKRRKNRSLFAFQDQV